MHTAALNNDVETLRVLLDTEPGLVDEQDFMGQTPLSRACDRGCLEAARLLIDRGADIEARDIGETSILEGACESGFVEIVSLLLDRGADPLRPSAHLSTPVEYATMGTGSPGSDHIALLRLLLKDGRLPVDARGEGGTTALLLSCFGGYADRARVLLLEGRADHTLADDHGRTPMLWAQERGNEECVRLLQVSERGQNRL